MFKSSRTEVNLFYLWSMLCENISVGNRFDFASSRTHRTNQLVIGLIPGNQSVDCQRPKHYYRLRALSVTVEELGGPHVD